MGGERVKVGEEERGGGGERWQSEKVAGRGAVNASLVGTLV